MADKKDQMSTAPVVSRRRFIARTAAFAAAMTFSACDRRFVRPGEELRLGTVRSLLYPHQHIRSKAILLYRDKEGWSAMSTRCTYDGCDLTFQEQEFLCSCCESEFSHTGEVYKGPAKDPLPWYEIYYKDTFLFANAYKKVSRNYRFTEPKIEAALEELARKVRTGEVAPRTEIPQILLGKGDKQVPQEMEKFERKLEYTDERKVRRETKDITKGN